MEEICVPDLPLRCSPKLVFELGHDPFDFAFGPTPGITVLSLEKEHEIAAPPVHTIDFV
jgi:hypothetical protein